MVNGNLTGSSVPIYIHPTKPVGDSENVHGVLDRFLQDQPLYQELADTLSAYLKGAEILAHIA